MKNDYRLRRRRNIHVVKGHQEGEMKRGGGGERKKKGGGGRSLVGVMHAITLEC